MQTLEMKEILLKAKYAGASDVHLTVGSAPVFRLNGEIFRQESWPVLRPEDTEKMSREMMNDQLKAMFEKDGEVDFAYAIPGVSRFRVNIFRQRGSYCASIRVVNSEIPSLDQIGMPPVLAKLARRPKGLVLITGPAGSGKSTTLAAMINLINQEKKSHILTLEDPIEYLHWHQNCIVNQREIGLDSPSFNVALKDALREDPDVLMIGEMRDLDTISTALTAAETGHLVLASLHTSGAVQTVERIIDVFPPHQQQQIRIQLADTIQGVVSQVLVRRADRQGRAAAVEVLISTPAVRTLIREGKTHQLTSLIQAGSQYGMQTLKDSIKELVGKGIISWDEVASGGFNAS
ncbi:MAG: type IV pilus twitching motility protein PilT [Desulfitobacteriaceae bacterium]|nr:type IV pilus twitching motility protein PilT [Desulfitobacteriaceae bacterium]MDD4753762.1 type IV pilus twitching motility protein PilT [Desulfitobacteriaceae bacterium]